MKKTSLREQFLQRIKTTAEEKAQSVVKTEVGEVTEVRKPLRRRGRPRKIVLDDDDD